MAVGDGLNEVVHSERNEIHQSWIFMLQDKLRNVSPKEAGRNTRDLRS